MTIWLEHLSGGRITFHDADGVRTRSLEAGEQGTVVFLLHGTWGHAEAYSRNVVALAARGFRVYAIDMVGHGLTGSPGDCSFLIGDYVRHLWDFAAAVCPGEKVHLVGESLGGWVAMSAALERPEQVASVVNVVGGGLRPIPPTVEETRGWAGLEDRSARVLAEPSFENWRERMEWLVLEPAGMSDEMVHVRAAMYSSEERALVARRVLESVVGMLRSEMPGALSPQDIAQVKVPVLYLWTDHNPTTPTIVARAAQNITPSARLAVMSDCAHWPQYERPEEFNRLVGDYLNERTRNL